MVLGGKKMKKEKALGLPGGDRKSIGTWFKGIHLLVKEAESKFMFYSSLFD